MSRSREDRCHVAPTHLGRGGGGGRASTAPGGMSRRAWRFRWRGGGRASADGVVSVNFSVWYGEPFTPNRRRPGFRVGVQDALFSVLGYRAPWRGWNTPKTAPTAGSPRALTRAI